MKLSCMRCVIVLVLVLLSSCANEQHQPASQLPPSQKGAAQNVDSIKHAKFDDEEIDTTKFDINDSTITLKNDRFPNPSGKVVNIMVTGVDSRLGDNMAHADANHLLRFFVDSGCVEIISIPRDTYYDAGFEDSTGLNKLTNVRANRGRTRYLQAIAEICGVPKVDYWVEFGFSQAIGLLELLGYKDNASSTLRVLRSRQAFSAGDFQRVYNQGQFMRQAILRNFHNTQTFIGDLAIRAALMMVETNLTYAVCDDINTQLSEHGFKNDPTRIWVRLKPAMIARMKVYEFDSSNVNEISRQIAHRVSRLGLDSVQITEETYERRLYNLLVKAQADSAKSPRSVVRLLKRPFEQRAWLQISELAKRKAYRNKLCGMLIASYKRLKDVKSADEIQRYIDMENKVIEGR